MWEAITAHPGQAIGWAIFMLTVGACTGVLLIGLGAGAARGDLKARYAMLRTAAHRHLRAYREPNRALPGESDLTSLRRIHDTLAEQDEATAALRRELSFGQ